MSSKKVKITAECIVNGSITAIGTVVEVDDTTFTELLNANRAIAVDEEGNG